MGKQYLKQILIIAIITLISCACLVFSCLYIDTFYNGFFYNNNVLCKGMIFMILSVLTILTIIFFGNKKEFVYKLFLIILAIFLFLIIALYILKKTNLLEKFDSVENFRKYIESFGSTAWLLFTLIQFLQVVVLPIPAFITVGAGTLLFGPFWGGVYSSFGIITGSIVAFFIGKIFGYRAVKWLIGEKTLQKGLKLIKGKDKVIITFMFLFPFFPDDVICFISGITTISPLFFIVMIFITRIISIFASTYSMNNSLIPYDTWWGILLWVIIFALAIIISYVIIKNSKKIEEFFKKKFKRKK